VFIKKNQQPEKRNQRKEILVAQRTGKPPDQNGERIYGCLHDLCLFDGAKVEL
jgi:hypothetical protein